MNWDYILSLPKYYYAYVAYYVDIWWFGFKQALYTNPGFVFLLWQNLMLTICAIYLVKIRRNQ